MKTQKELKDLYMEIINAEVWPKSPKMQEFARKQVGYIIELSNGKIICLDKPSIEKDFCFGYGMYLRSTDEEEDRAFSMAQKAETDPSYFLEQNLRNLNLRIEQLRNVVDWQKEVYIYVNYCGQPADSDLVSYTITDIFEGPKLRPEYWKRYEGLQKIGEDDIQRIIHGLEEAKKAFEKRLNTYLKKYGLSKLNVWTYLVD